MLIEVIYPRKGLDVYLMANGVPLKFSVFLEVLDNKTRDQQDTLTSLVNGDRELRHNIDSVANRVNEISSKLSSKLSNICLIERIM